MSGNTRAPAVAGRFSMPRWLLTGLVSLTACLAAGLVPVAAPAAPTVPRTVETSGLELITGPTQQAINRGLEYLAVSPYEDGSFGSGSAYRRNVAVTALSGMAFLSAGNTPNRGKYGKNVELAVQLLLSCVEATRLMTSPEGRKQKPMYGHGFATLFLAEVYGMTPRPEIREKLKLAVNLIVNSQNKEGGWRYQPVRRDADVSVTVCQIMALRAARNAGIYVPKNTV